MGVFLWARYPCKPEFQNSRYSRQRSEIVKDIHSINKKIVEKERQAGHAKYTLKRECVFVGDGERERARECVCDRERDLERDRERDTVCDEERERERERV